MEIDGRTKLAKAMRNHPDIDASDSDYVTIDGVSRYQIPIREAYTAFRKTLEKHDIDYAVHVYTRLD